MYRVAPRVVNGKEPFPPHRLVPCTRTAPPVVFHTWMYLEFRLNSPVHKYPSNHIITGQSCVAWPLSVEYPYYPSSNKPTGTYSLRFRRQLTTSFAPLRPDVARTAPLYNSSRAGLHGKFHLIFSISSPLFARSRPSTREGLIPD